MAEYPIREPQIRTSQTKAEAQELRFVGVDVRYLLSVVLVAVAYVAFAKIGFMFAFSTKQITAVWPPSGIAVAVLLLGGYRLWPGVLLGALIINATTSETLTTAAGIAIGNTLGPLAAVYMLRRFAAFESPLERLRDVLALVVLGSALAMTITATNGVLNLALAGTIPWSAFRTNWILWWLGDAMGVLLVAPLILTWLTPRRPQDVVRRSPAEMLIFAVLLASATALLFLSRSSLSFPLYPFVIWTALRFGQRGTSLAVFAISAFAVWGTIHGLGPFTVGSPDHRLSLLVVFMAVMAVTGLVLGAIDAERRAARTQLEVAEKRFHSLAERVPQMVWTADATGWIDWFNHRWYEYTGETREEAIGWGWQRAHHPDDYPRVMHDWPRSIATGRPFDMESRIKKHDGTFRWFLVRAEPLRDAGDAIVRWYGTNTDVDDQKRAHRESDRIAETLQASFLPGLLPVRADLRFDALYIAAEREAFVGGDWYDAFELPDGHIVVSIGDVAGHGVAAAATAVRIRQGIIGAALEAADPRAILSRVNRVLQFQGDTMATALVAIIDPGLSTMRYASAGHPPPIVATPTSPGDFLPCGDPPLGLDAKLDAQTRSVALGQDAVVFFYTDGFTEFKQDIASAERALRDAATRLVGDTAVSHPAAAVQHAVMGSAKAADDAVLLVLQLSPAPVMPLVDGVDMRKTWAFHSSDAYSARMVRRELMNFVRRYVPAEDDLFHAELIIGEVLANTVKHAPGVVTLALDWTEMHPVLTVVDDGPGSLKFAPTLPDDTLTEDGRGLFLIGALAKDVQVESTPGRGTKMTLRLDVARQM